MEDKALRSLAVQAATGDLDAAEALIKGVHGDLFSFLHLQGIPADAIEDVAQEVVYQMYASLTRYSANWPLLPWLRGIARHVAANHRRSKGREAMRLHAFWEQVRRQVDARATEPAPLNLDRERLLTCIERLPDKQKELVRLRYFQELNCEEVARETGLQAAAVRQALSRVRLALRLCVESLRGTDESRVTT